MFPNVLLKRREKEAVSSFWFDRRVFDLFDIWFVFKSDGLFETDGMIYTKVFWSGRDFLILWIGSEIPGVGIGEPVSGTWISRVHLINDNTTIRHYHLSNLQNLLVSGGGGRAPCSFFNPHDSTATFEIRDSLIRTSTLSFTVAVLCKKTSMYFSQRQDFRAVKSDHCFLFIRRANCKGIGYGCTVTLARKQARSSSVFDHVTTNNKHAWAECSMTKLNRCYGESADNFYLAFYTWKEKWHIYYIIIWCNNLHILS